MFFTHSSILSHDLPNVLYVVSTFPMCLSHVFLNCISYGLSNVLISFPKFLGVPYVMPISPTFLSNFWKLVFVMFQSTRPITKEFFWTLNAPTTNWRSIVTKVQLFWRKRKTKTKTLSILETTIIMTSQIIGPTIIQNWRSCLKILTKYFNQRTRWWDHQSKGKSHWTSSSCEHNERRIEQRWIWRKCKWFWKLSD